MSKVSVVTLVSELTLGAASDATIVGNYYDRVVEDLARFPWMTNFTVVAPLDAVNAPGYYTLETSQVKILAVFWDIRQLGRLTLEQVEGMNRTWRNEIGEPHSFIVEDEPQKSIRVYPIPSTTAPLTVIHTETREDALAWLELPIALETAAREMERESPHRDVEWATQAHVMAEMLFAMVGGS